MKPPSCRLRGDARRGLTRSAPPCLPHVPLAINKRVGTAKPTSAFRLDARRVSFDDPNLFFGQAVEVVDELIDLPVGRGDLGCDGGQLRQRTS